MPLPCVSSPKAVAHTDDCPSRCTSSRASAAIPGPGAHGLALSSRGAGRPGQGIAPGVQQTTGRWLALGGVSCFTFISRPPAPLDLGVLSSRSQAGFDSSSSSACLQALFSLQSARPLALLPRGAREIAQATLLHPHCILVVRARAHAKPAHSAAPEDSNNNVAVACAREAPEV
jgi:hypothetical protein